MKEYKVREISYPSENYLAGSAPFCSSSVRRRWNIDDLDSGQLYLCMSENKPKHEHYYKLSTNPRSWASPIVVDGSSRVQFWYSAEDKLNGWIAEGYNYYWLEVECE